jgi:acetyl esterase
MALDPSTRFVLRILEHSLPGGRLPRDIPSLRALTGRAPLPLWLPRLRMASVRDGRIPGPAGAMRVRLYRPWGMIRGVVLFMHGGGFVHCSLDSHDGICCWLARVSGCVVASLDYRLAPEHRFPAAPQDAYAALSWIASNHRALGAPAGAGIAVAGDSAGGNLAAVVSQMARDRDGPKIAFQLLYYPSTHGAKAVPSRTAYGTGYFLTTDLMRWYMAQYLGGQYFGAQYLGDSCLDEPSWETACLDEARAGAHPSITDPAFAPFLASSLADLPPALVITAEYDPLRDEGAEYAARLRRSGVRADYHCVSGVIHGFLNFYPFQAKARDALTVGADAIRRGMAEHEQARWMMSAV